MTASAQLRTNIETRRDALGISTRELERRAGLGTSTISRFLAKPEAELSLDVITKAATALECSLGELLGLEAGATPNAVRPMLDATPEDGDLAGVRLIPIDALAPSPLNPRKSAGFKPEDIEELAKSIAAKGVMQNLVARPDPRDPTKYEIVAGERRWRAAKMAFEQGWTIQGFVPVAIHQHMTDAELVELAIAENVVRRDMTPLEEADALAFLHDQAKGEDGVKDFTQRLMKVCGKSDRWVQQRVKLARQLVPEARQRLETGDISLQMALELSALPKAAQVHANAKIGKAWGWDNASTLVATLARELPLADQALFKHDLYDGGFVERDGKRHFADVKQAEKLQDEAVKAKKAEMAKGRSFVVVMNMSWDWAQKYPPAPKGTKAAERGAVILRSGFSVEIHDNRLPKDVASKATAEEPEYQKENRRMKARIPFKKAWMAQLAPAFTRDPVAALRTLVLRSVSPIYSHCFRSLGEGAAPAPLLASVSAILDVALPPIPAILSAEDESTDEAAYDAAEAEYEAAVVEALEHALAAAAQKDLLRCFAEIFAHQLTEANDYRLQGKTTRFDVAVARFAGIALPAPLQAEASGGEILDFASEPEPGDDQPDVDDAEDGDGTFDEGDD